jgi:hypothetical protein
MSPNGESGNFCLLTDKGRRSFCRAPFLIAQKRQVGSSASHGAMRAASVAQKAEKHLKTKHFKIASSPRNVI